PLVMGRVRAIGPVRLSGDRLGRLKNDNPAAAMALTTIAIAIATTTVESKHFAPPNPNFSKSK
ncbi:hypothetical protein, partial [Bordetella muralis]|uniref:hypothetical protein n=1 Tax=Bordetella muralis TaxID=1649130 RepID=UPI0039EFF1D1